MSDWKDELKAVAKALKSPQGTKSRSERAAVAPATTHRAIHMPSGPLERPTKIVVPAATQVVPPEPIPKSPVTILELPRPTRLVREREFRPAAPWVGRGCQTQAVAVPRGRAVHVFIGLDFGTAYTKAAVGLLDKVFPVDWSGIRDSPEPYLLPSEYTAPGGGQCFLGQHPTAESGDLVTGLKQDFIAGTISKAAICRAAVFVGLVLQYIRAWVFEQHGAKLAGRPVRWQLNIGVPSDGFEDAGRREAYQRLMRLAWSLSLRSATSVSFDAATQVVIDLEGTLPCDLVEADAVPEFVAQLAGYAKSAQRRNGLHVLVDIGGGTADMVTFNVHHVDGEDVFPFFVPSVEPLGTFGLIANRLRGGRAVSESGDKPLSELTDPEEFAGISGMTAETVRRCDDHFLGRVSASFGRVLQATRQRRYRLAPEWRLGVRTFVTGGGARVNGYQDALHRGRPADLQLVWLDLPPPSNLDGFDVEAHDYQRVSVACGLARNALSLGLIRPASEVEDDLGSSLSSPAPPQRERLNHEDLYPR
ncbi:hypothetical protein [Variovorax sp. LjRoot178]|uniref:hypothetical protein n=1 Tax=Variovorax sp. LjRoot178 TaxID=3342277 RepID=UPI003ECF3759